MSHFVHIKFNFCRKFVTSGSFDFHSEEITFLWHSAMRAAVSKVPNHLVIPIIHPMHSSGPKDFTFLGGPSRKKGTIFAGKSKLFVVNSKNCFIVNNFVQVSETIYSYGKRPHFTGKRHFNSKN